MKNCEHEKLCFSCRKANKNLKILSNYGNISSNLKKKLSLINRLKNINNEAFNALLKEMEQENFMKFQTEIVNNLLSNLISVDTTIYSTISKIHNIVEIVYLYSFDNSFINYLYNELKKTYLQNFAYSSFFLEIFWLVKKPNMYEAVAAIKKIFYALIKNNDKTMFILYLMLSFCCFYPNDEKYSCNKGVINKNNDEMDKKLRNNFSLLNNELLTGELHKIFSDFIKNEIKEVNENDLEIFEQICALLKIDQKIVVKDETIKLIKIEPNEFLFYENIKLEKDFKFYNLNLITDFIESFLKNIKKIFEQKENIFENFEKIYKFEDKTDFEKLCTVLDFVGFFIKNNSAYFDMFLNKLKDFKKIEHISYLARILSKSQNNKIRSYLDDPNNLYYNELVLISEMYKFRIIKSDEIFDLLNYYLTNNYFDKLKILFSNLGRFLLANKSTNKLSADFIDKMNNYKCNEFDKLGLKNCLLEVINPQSPKIGILDFFSWYFSNFDKVKKNEISLFEKMKKSKKLCILLFLRPSLFINTHKMVEFIVLFDMVEIMIKFYLNILPLIESKTNYYQFLEVLSYLSEKTTNSDKYIDLIIIKIMDLKVSTEFKHRSILKVLESVSKKSFKTFCKNQIRTMNEIEFQSDMEIKSLLFNLYEKNNISIQNNQKKDFDNDFENQILFMRDFSD